MTASVTYLQALDSRLVRGKQPADAGGGSRNPPAGARRNESVGPAVSDHLRDLANRVEADPFFSAYRLAEYALAHGGLSDVGLAARLGCPVETLVNLRLCRAPRNDADVLTIARRFGLDPVRLTQVLREPPGP